MRYRLHTVVAILFWQVGLAQQRYVDEVFTEAQLELTTDVAYATNTDFLFINPNCATLMAEFTDLQAFTDQGLPYPGAYLDPDDPSTCVKLTSLFMDIHAPAQDVDPCEARPLVLVLHDGGLLPPPMNARPYGMRTDSSVTALCRTLARRGYVAAAVDQRYGWNPLITSLDARRGSFLNAIYRAMHDVRAAVRWWRAQGTGNGWAVDPDRIAVVGAGSGAMVALATAYWDDPEELFSGQLLPLPWDSTISYIDTTLVGGIDGTGGHWNLYRDNGHSAEIQFVGSLGGGLVDTLWIAPGDIPAAALHCIHDVTFPFDHGTWFGWLVDPLFQVNGGQAVMRRSNNLGNNDPFSNMPGGDPHTDRARSLYGTIVDGVTIGNGAQAEGLFPVVRPMNASAFQESQPWHWWDPQGTFALVEIAPGFTTHDQALLYNPDMSATKGMAYIDTVAGYLAPRIKLSLDPLDCVVGTPDHGTEPHSIKVEPNPAKDRFTITSSDSSVHQWRLFDQQGRLLRSEVSNHARTIIIERGDLPSGLYLLHVQVATGTEVLPVVLE